MVPFHPLRHEARVRAARALASVATFCVIAAALLTASVGDEGATSASAAPGEPVLATPAQVAQQTAPPPAEAPPTEEPLPPPVEEPPAPPVEEPPAPPVEEPPAGETPPPAEEPTAPPVEEPAEPPPGGGGKDVPGDPVEPETPPIPDPDEPAPDPGPAPSGNGGSGRPGIDEPGAPTPSGGSKGEVGPPAEAPPGAGDGGQGSTPGEPTTQPTTPPEATGVQGLNPEAGSGARRGDAPGDTPQGGNGGTPGTNFGIGGGGGAGGTLGVTAAPAPLSAAAIVPGATDGGGATGAGGGNGSGGEQDGAGDDTTGEAVEQFGQVFGSVPELLEFVPESFKIALAGLAALSILLGLGYLLSAIRNRRLERQRGELLKEVGLLQTALLPPVPDRIGALRTSVAYRPADGPGAGGDFYDVLPLAGGRVGFILGDVSGHGRGALARTAFMRYTLRAYLEAGLEPRVALQVAGRVIDENLGGDFATVLLAVHDPETGSLTYATAGHPAPIVVGPQPHEPVTTGSSPPIGVGVKTGLRQTTVPLVPGAVACLFTDGLMEARVNGGILGRDRLEELLAELGTGATAAGLIASVRDEARVLSDDIAAVIIQPTTAATAGLFRTEQLELSTRELDGPMAANFLESCGFSTVEIEAAIYDARALAERFGGVILHVVFGNRLRVEVLPRNVESIEAASRRAAASR